MPYQNQNQCICFQKKKKKVVLKNRSQKKKAKEVLSNNELRLKFQNVKFAATYLIPSTGLNLDFSFIFSPLSHSDLF